MRDQGNIAQNLSPHAAAEVLGAHDGTSQSAVILQIVVIHASWFIVHTEFVHKPENFCLLKFRHPGYSNKQYSMFQIKLFVIYP